MASEPRDPKADLLWEYVDRVNAGEPIDEARMRAEHPEAADELLVQLKAFTRIGAAEAEGGEETPLGVLGDYRLLRQVGRGGMGVVYEARQASLERRVALKVLPAGLLTDSRAIARFVREAKVAAGLQHPNVVPVFGIEVQANTPYFTMEFVDGETLAQRLARLRAGQAGAGEVDARYCFEMALAFAGAAEGVQHAHSKGVIHRDLKPSNLILDREGRLRILDFGLARLEGQESITVTGDFVGTPAYMSPEQAKARKVGIDHRTDVYSLGASLYEAVTLRPPFRGRDPQDTLSQIIARDPEPPRKLNPRTPKDLETIVLKCLRKVPGDRYGTAEALAQDLRRFARGDPIEARPQAALARFARKASRYKWRLTVAAVMAILLATTGLLLERSRREAEGRRTADYESAVRAAVIKLQVRHPTLEVAAGKAMRVKPFLIDAKDFQSEAADGSEDPAEQAAAELEAAVRSVPGRPDAHFQRARALLLAGRRGEAKAALEEATRAAPDFLPARVLRANLLAEDGDREGAGREMAAVEQSGRAGWAEAWLSARQALGEAKWTEAAAAYGKLIEMERSEREPYLGASIELRMGRGLARLEAKDFTGAIEDLVAARMLAPSAPQPGLLLGKAYFLKGEETDAERTFEEVLGQAKRELPARRADQVALAVVAIYHYHVQLEDALLWAARIGDGSVREGIRAGILCRLWRYAEAREAAKKAIESNPRDTRAHANLVVCLNNLQRYAEAEEVVGRAVAIDPDDFRLHLVRCGLLESMGKLDLALEAGQKTLELNDTSAVTFNALARIYRKMGNTTSAFAMIHKAIEVAPGEPWAHEHLGDALVAQGQPEEALAAYRRALALDPRNGAPRLRAFLIRDGAGDLGPELKRLLELLESIFAGRRPFRRDLSELFQLAISALLARPGGDGREQAIRRCRRAAEATGRKQPEVLAALAEAQSANGLLAEAVLTLEEALSLQHAGRSLEPALARYREALLPDLASYASIDSAIAACGGADRERILESFRAAARGETAASRIAYLEARLLEEASRPAEAAEKLQPLLDRGDGRPEPLLHLAECLRRTGDAQGAEGQLRDALARPLHSGANDLWRLWAAICFVDLQRRPAEMLAGFPAEVRGYGADLRWLLEELASGKAIRINCGGEEHRGPEGETWGRDRFFSSGYANFESWGRSDHYSGDIQGTEYEIPYQTARWFPAGGRGRAGYFVPLPPAKYRVTLHFAETWFTEPKQRSFDVLIEGEEVLKDYEPLSKGFATADLHGFQTEVKDGALEIELVHRVEDPMVSAIEIEAIQ